MNEHVVMVRPRSGVVAVVWAGGPCSTCGHRAGMAEVRHPDGRMVQLTGASCWAPRRGVPEALAWAMEQADAMESVSSQSSPRSA